LAKLEPIRACSSPFKTVLSSSASPAPRECAVIARAVQPSAGEYWDHAGIKGFKYLWQGATAYIRGDRLTTDAAMHTPRMI
jgi:hypothetical protein